MSYKVELDAYDPGSINNGVSTYFIKDALCVPYYICASCLVERTCLFILNNAYLPYCHLTYPQGQRQSGFPPGSGRDGGKKKQDVSKVVIYFGMCVCVCMCVYVCVCETVCLHAQRFKRLLE